MRKYEFKLRESFLYSNKITEKQFDDTLIRQENNQKNRETIIAKGLGEGKSLLEVLEDKLGIPYIDLEKYMIKSEIVLKIPETIARRYDLIAIDLKDNLLMIAMADPLNIFAIDDVKLHTQYEIQPVMSNRKSIRRCIDKYYKKGVSEKLIEELSSNHKYDDIESIDEEELLEIRSAPVVKLLNSMIERAIELKASDIHIEPSEDIIRIRFRIDGDLNEILRLSINIYSALITRIKIMGQMNIAEKRIPQDGRVDIKFNGKEIDLRISTMPTIHGEKIVIRILDRENFFFTKSELGLNEENLKLFNKILKQPYGIVLTTGPTGCGKTSTLYAILKELNNIEKNIITIEDPVEYKLEGINQVQVNVKAGLTFASGLRSILRQDPDIIMIGEIRDTETAKIATRAAITGHLVLSTLHTNDSPSSIIRLIDMGIEPYLVSSAVIGVISQRLIKKLCPNCKISYEANLSEKSLLGIDQKESVILYKAKGCNECNNGFIGRRAVHEIMLVNESMRELISKGASVDKLRIEAINSGMTTLLNNSIKLAIEGVSTLEECLKAGYTLG
ncbi:GspE/PulE family protein [Tepidimicrobium xylanilyticum]|uniref:GspE/PulE family protein n=1 Tax=Tepidimicrobium xylanilyticum TaxID=1123352 RepID=UPI0026572039|nr:GspE/PulE family protein [Tepidimicrobium xylanilyticum]GMG97690.1 type II secretion system protein E [Tepidimicrobium xylanilyticum]